jgi:ribonuclease PH
MAPDRATDELRPLTLEADPSPYAEGSCLVSTGQTRILCTASVEEGLPPWRERSGAGWVTAEYGMLPRATHTRNSRERGGARGRTQEIQRLIGRSLRSVTDMGALGPRTIIVDCDVLQADGGTRTAAITGGCVALVLACRELVNRGLIETNPVLEMVAAVSAGIVEGQPTLDLDYRQDSTAQVDMNVVATAGGRLIEVQGTAEGHPFERKEMDTMLDLALDGIARLVTAQERFLSGAGEPGVGA